GIDEHTIVVGTAGHWTKAIVVEQRRWQVSGPDEVAVASEDSPVPARVIVAAALGLPSAKTRSAALQARASDAILLEADDLLEAMAEILANDRGSEPGGPPAEPGPLSYSIRGP